MRFARVDVNGVTTYGVQHTDGKYYDLPRMLEKVGQDTVVPKTLLDAALDPVGLAAKFADAVQELSAVNLLDSFALPGNARLLAPIERPNRILAIGRNYAAHAKEQGKEVFEEPIVFLKASTCVIGHDAPIVIPEWLGRVDFEAELLVVLGKGGRYVSEDNAMDLVAGYTIFNDVTAREVQKADQARQHPWFRSKSMDTFGPMGPSLVTADEVPDPHNLRISLTVNGVTKQDDTTASLIYRLPTLIAFLSKWFLLEPGDVIATGTPSGIGPIVPGDVVEVTVEGLGTLRNPVIAETVNSL